MFYHFFNKYNPTQPHEVRDRHGNVIYRTRMKSLALQRVFVENNKVYVKTA